MASLACRAAGERTNWSRGSPCSLKSGFFEIGFQHQVLRFDRTCAALYGEIRHAREAAGKPISVEDAMIAATARAYGVRTIVTRNTKDFVDCGVASIDPWLV